MEKSIRQISLNLGKMDQRNIRLVLVILSLILFVIGAGAPATGGGIGG